MGSIKKIKGYYPTSGEWLPVKVDADGKLVISAPLPLKYAARAYLSADQDNIAAGGAGAYRVNLNAVSYDIGSNFDTVNHCFIVSITGYYLVKGTVVFESTDMSANTRNMAYIYVDPLGVGAPAVKSHGNDLYYTVAAQWLVLNVSDILHLNATDKVYLYAGTSDTNVDIESAETETSLSIVLLGV
jgi:hypothetical protein